MLGLYLDQVLTVATMAVRLHFGGPCTLTLEIEAVREGGGRRQVVFVVDDQVRLVIWRADRADDAPPLMWIEDAGYSWAWEAMGERL